MQNSCYIQKLFLSLQRDRITGNVRTPRERIHKGRARVSCRGGFILIDSCLTPLFFIPVCKSIKHNGDYMILRARPLFSNHLKLKDMKRKYCLIRNFGRMRPGHFIYTIYVGRSDREQVLLAVIQEYCKDVGYYFKLWSPEVDSAISLAEKPFVESGCPFKSPFIRASLSVKDLYEKIVDGSIESFEDKFAESQFSLWMQFSQSTDYCQSFNNKKSNTECPPYRRKNLSRKMRTCDEIIILASLAYFAIVVAAKFIEDICL